MMQAAMQKLCHVFPDSPDICVNIHRDVMMAARNSEGLQPVSRVYAHRSVNKVSVSTARHSLLCNTWRNRN